MNRAQGMCWNERKVRCLILNIMTIVLLRDSLSLLVISIRIAPFIINL